MTGDILRAIMYEAKALFIEMGGTVLLKTDYRASKLPTYSMPLLLIDFTEAPDTYQCLGGQTRCDFNIGFNSYNFMPDPTTDDPDGYSQNLMDIVDVVRQHFSAGIWSNLTQSPTITDILNNYCFKFTLSGLLPADAISEDGLKMGWKIMFDCTGIDDATDSVEDSTQVLTDVTQVNNPPFD